MTITPEEIAATKAAIEADVAALGGKAGKATSTLVGIAAARGAVSGSGDATSPADTTSGIPDSAKQAMPIAAATTLAVGALTAMGKRRSKAKAKASQAAAEQAQLDVKRQDARIQAEEFARALAVISELPEESAAEPADEAVEAPEPRDDQDAGGRGRSFGMVLVLAAAAGAAAVYFSGKR